jgi:hypothetical protein
VSVKPSAVVEIGNSDGNQGSDVLRTRFHFLLDARLGFQAGKPSFELYKEVRNRWLFLRRNGQSDEPARLEPVHSGLDRPVSELFDLPFGGLDQSWDRPLGHAPDLPV